MSANFQLEQHPWLSALTVILAEAIALIFFSVVVVGLFKQPWDAPLTGFIVTLLGHVTVLFILIPFVLNLPGGTRSFSDYIAAIRLSHLQPFLRLLLLGLSCYLILALCQASGVLIFRAFEGKPVTVEFVRKVFDLSGELPPKSSSWWISLPSVLEEVAFRGVILSLFLSKYSERPAILFAALGFGAMHLLNLASGRELVWVLGQVVWAAILGVFYGVVVLKSNSLWPAMVVHYLGNLFVGSLNTYLQTSASIQTQVVYGITFTFGIVPTMLMILWVILFTKFWPVV